MTNKNKCCGCTACIHICPQKCITMEEDEEGFLYPVIDKEKCVRCYQCEKICPIRNKDYVNMEIETFVGYSRNEENRKKSSSGGVFSVIAEWILQQNGVVYGAAFDENFEVHHVAIKTEAELKRLRGSKYVQSRLENIYPEVKKYLDSGCKVLFTGLACQIAGLKKYLIKEYENLYTTDVLCHGVPSPKIWRMYLEEKEEQYHASIMDFEFRNKEKGWKNFSLNILFSNNERYLVNFFEDNYMRMFLGNIDLRPSCYDCRFKDFPRMSDMTIGDGWGIEKYMPDMDDDQGISVILVNSLKGHKMFDAIRNKLFVREAILDKVLPRTAESRRSVEMHPNRKKYWEGVKKGESIDILSEYVKKTFIQKIISYIRYMMIKINLK